MGMGVLSCRGVELESEFPFGAATRLLGPALDRLGPQERRRALSGFAANAADLFHPGTTEVPLEGPGHERSVVRSLRQLTVNLTLSRALHPHPSTVVILDDAQWSDTASLRFLAHLGTDITRLPIFVVAACEPGSGDARAVLRQMLAASPGARRLRLARLSLEGVACTVRLSYSR